VEALVQLPSRNEVKTAWLVLRYPGAKPIRAVEFEGKPWQEFEAAKQQIRLPITTGPMRISAHF
jgi:hypothetical protein